MTLQVEDVLFNPRGGKIVSIVLNDGSIYVPYDTKYRWHNLKSNSQDLPEDCSRCIVCIEFEYGFRYYDCYFNRGEFKVSNSSLIVAWKYLEPFEKEDL